LLWDNTCAFGRTIENCGGARAVINTGIASIGLTTIRIIVGFVTASRFAGAGVIIRIETIFVTITNIITIKGGVDRIAASNKDQKDEECFFHSKYSE